MLRVLFEGVVGELELPPGIRMLLATNETQDAAGGWEISPAMANRVGWIEWEGVTVDRFASYLAYSQGRGSGALPIEPIDFQVEERAVDELWDQAWMQATMLVTGFLKSREELFHKRPKDGEASRAWPSARTWDLACHALAGSFVYDLSAIERKIAVEAYIGSGAFGEFYAYAKDADLPDPAKFLDGEQPFEHQPARLDRTAALLSGCVAKVVPKDSDKREDRAKALWKFLLSLPESAVDVSMGSVIELTQASLILGLNDAYKVLSRHDGVMDAAGMR